MLQGLQLGVRSNSFWRLVLPCKVQLQIAVLSGQALGIAVDIGPEGVSRCLDGAGVGFMFAPRCVCIVFIIDYGTSKNRLLHRVCPSLSSIYTPKLPIKRRLQCLHLLTAHGCQAGFATQA